jgi:hypothetical protein
MQGRQKARKQQVSKQDGKARHQPNKKKTGHQACKLESNLPQAS